MSEKNLAQYADHPKFKELVGKRVALSYLLSVIVIVSFSSWVLVMSFAPELLALPLWEGAATNIGIVCILVLLSAGIIIPGIYTWWANTRLDRLKEEFLKEIQNEK